MCICMYIVDVLSLSKQYHFQHGALTPSNPVRYPGEWQFGGTSTPVRYPGEWQFGGNTYNERLSSVSNEQDESCM